MKLHWSLSVVTATLLASITASKAQPWGGNLYWDPLTSNTTGAGGTGTWNTSSANWYTNPGRLTWSSTTTIAVATSSTVGLGYTNLYFGGTGQSSPYTLTIGSDISSIGATSTINTSLIPFNMYFQGDYAVQTARTGGTTIGTSSSYVYTNLYADAGKTVTLGGNGNQLTIQGGGNSSATPSVLFSGGGSFVMKDHSWVNQSSTNGRITLGAAGARTSFTMDDSTATVNAARIYVDNGVFTVNSGTVVLNNTLNSTSRSGIQIGNTAALSGTNAPSVFNMNGGYVSVVMTNTNTATNLNHGIVFATGNNGYNGGTFNLNGGLLTVQDILGNASAGTSEFVFNGGTLAVSNVSNQAQLNAFMSGFGTTGSNRVFIGSGGAYIDTNNIDGATNGKAVISSAISGTGGLSKTGANTLVLSATNTYTGTTTVNSGTLQLGNGGAAGSIAGDLVNNGTVEFNRSNFNTYGGAISGTGSLVKVGAQTLYLQGTNSYTGNTVVNGGFLRIDYDVNLGNVSSTLILNSGSLRVIDTVSGAGIFIARGLQLAGTGGAVYTDKFVNWDGLVSGSGVLTKLGGDTLSLNNAANTFTGNVQVDAGILRIRGGDGSLGAAGNDLTLANGTTFSVQNNTVTPLTTINANRTATLTSGNVTFNTVTATQLEGNITGAGGLTKIGASAFTVNGSADYQGATVVSVGTMAVNGDFSAVTGGFTVSSGATLSGTGTIGSAVSVQGTIAAGNSIGTLSVQSLSIGSTGTLGVELGRSAGTPVNDVVNVTGSVTLDSGSNLSLTLYTGLDAPQIGDVFYLLNNDGVDGIGGVFTSLNGAATTLNEGSTFVWNSLEWTITYEANFGSSFTGGNDLAIMATAVPEPSTYLLIGAGLAMAFLGRRKKQA